MLSTSLACAGLVFLLLDEPRRPAAPRPVDPVREQARLAELCDQPGPALILIYGRRRVGKTYFLQNALESRGGIYFLAAESSSFASKKSR